MELFDRIRIVRKHYKLTQREFADKIDLQQNSINRIENGSRNPSERTLKDICNTFNVNYVWLTEGIGDMLMESDDAILEELSAEYELSDLDLRIIKKYIELSSDDRAVINRFIANVQKKENP